MEKLESLISVLQDEEASRFKSFLKRKSGKDENKRLELFKLISRAKDKPTIIKKLYKNANDNHNAYYQLRKSLLEELEAFLLIQRSSSNSFTTILKKIDLASHTLNQLQVSLARGYMEEAQKLAIQNGHFELYFFIQAMGFKFSSSYFGENSDTSRFKMLRLFAQLKFGYYDLELAHYSTPKGLEVDDPNGLAFLKGIDQALEDLKKPNASTINLALVWAFVKAQLEKPELEPHLLFSFALSTINITNKLGYLDESQYIVQHLAPWMRQGVNLHLKVIAEFVYFQSELSILRGSFSKASEKLVHFLDRHNSQLTTGITQEFTFLLARAKFLQGAYKQCLDYLKMVMDHEESEPLFFRVEYRYGAKLLYCLAHFEISKLEGIEGVIKSVNDEQNPGPHWYEKAIEFVSVLFQNIKSNYNEIRPCAHQYLKRVEEQFSYEQRVFELEAWLVAWLEDVDMAEEFIRRSKVLETDFVKHSENSLA